MQQLPDNCRAGKFSVFPKNWKTVSANKNLKWRINYWFYDDNLKIKKQVITKGMNRAETVYEKQALVKIALEAEQEDLLNGYNPISNTYSIAYKTDISEHTAFIQALRYVYERLNCVHTTKLDINSTIKYIEISAMYLKYDTIPIGNIRRKHIKRILEHCAETKERWSANTFNAYRKNLGILFKELIEMEAVETNIIRDLSKQKTIRKIKPVLTPEECKKVSDWVKNYDYRFWLLINIFFHSGCRTTELFRLKTEHVNLEKQTALFTVLKGNQPFEVEKPIKNIAVEFWREALEGAKPGEYLFGKGLMPSKISINPRQATKRWKRHIKGKKEDGKLGLTCNWYALKYLNTDQITKERGLKTAGLLNSHTNESTTKIYAIGYDSREAEEIKGMKNKFAQ